MPQKILTLFFLHFMTTISLPPLSNFHSRSSEVHEYQVYISLVLVSFEYETSKIKRDTFLNYID